MAKKKVPVVEPAVEGETFRLYLGDDEEFDLFTVGPKCPENSGQWRCITHELGFGNQMQKDSHVSQPGRHILTWICSTHGPEVP